MMKLILLILVVVLGGCASMPCTYDGKLVSKADAERMKSLGMNVVCP